VKAASPSYRIVDTDEGFAEVVDALTTVHRYAVDTEFHRERTYFPKIALVQIAWADQVVIVDPLAVSLAPLRVVLEGDATAVMHAASQDLEVLDLACGAVPQRLFDTQLAAGFLGMSSPSLAALHERELGRRLPKGSRLTDWLERPLKDEQLDYAASDVAHLLEIHDRLVAQLTARGRLSWAEHECEELRRRAQPRRAPEEAWRRIKEVRHLKGRQLAIAQSVAAWRERRAATIDQPVRYVLSDLAIVAIAQSAPTTLDALRGIRGLDERHARGEIGQQLVAAVVEGTKNPPPPRDDTSAPEPSRTLRPAVALVSAWVSQLAKDLEIDPALLGTRADIEGLVRNDPTSRMASGWRAEVAGEPVRQLVEGRASLAFDGQGGLVLEPRD
jgi:ribonuclease D